MISKTVIYILLLLIACLDMYAYDFYANGIYCNILSDNSSVEVTYCSDDGSGSYYSRNIVIPSSVTIDGKTYNVTGIGDYAFRSCSSLTSVTIPNCVTSIGDYAFWGCGSLTSVTIPNSVISIGDGAFYLCSSLTSVTIPNSVTNIGDGAFYYSGINQPLFNNTVFAYLPTSYSGAYNIPAGITAIAGGAFHSCTSLRSVTIPNSVTSIGDGAFYDSGISQPLFNSTVFAYMPTSYCGAYNIPSGIKTITGSAFKGCDSLTSVTIPNGVTSIGNAVFHSCRSLTSVSIPNSVTSIGDYAFWRCESLTSVTIPNSVTSIGRDAFYNSGINQPLFSNTVFAYLPTSYSGAYNVPAGITTIAECAFKNCRSLTGVTIPNSVTSIGDYAFWRCESLTSVTIPNSVTSIGDNAFYSCGSLTSVTIPNGVTSIGNAVFYSCGSLTSVAIPNSVTSIGDVAFYSCSSLTSITIPNSVTSIGNAAFYGSGINHPLFNNTVFAYLPTSYGGAYNIPSGIKTIAGSAFHSCTSLRRVTIPNSVTRIGVFAFQGCTSLTSVTIPNSIRYIEYYLFAQCTSLTKISIPSSVTSIGHSAFWSSALMFVYFKGYNPPNVQYYAFKDISPIFYVPCGTVDAYKTVLNRDTTYSICGYFPFDITLQSADTALGTASVTRHPSCYNPQATVEAVTIPHYHLQRWSDGDTNNPRTITITSDTTLTAYFEKDRHTVSSDFELVKGTGEYYYGTSVTLTAQSNKHARFIKWEDGVTDSVRSFVISCDTIINAEYDLDSFLISTTCNNGSVSGGGLHPYKDIVTLTVTPDDGYRFVEWNDGNVYNPRVFVAEEDLTLEAICEEIPEVGVDDVEDEERTFYIVGRTVYNPANEMLKVYSACGKLVKTGDSDIEMEGLPVGVYMVVNERWQSQKVVITR